MTASYDEVMVSLGLEPSTPKRQPAEHGDYRRYTKGCRCGECRDAHRRAAKALRDKRRQDSSSADRAGHGKATTYRNHGCRCAECREANRLYLQRYRERRREREALAGAGAASC